MKPKASVALMAGAGNVFAVLDAREAPPHERAELARRWCARPPLDERERVLVGTLDGLLLIGPAEDGADCRMIVHNADGSRPETCGNGLRCAARFARERGMAKSDLVRVATDAGVCEVELLRERGVIVGARANLGPVRRVERDVELRGGFGAVRATLVDVGNPHCVLFVDDERDAPVRELGPLLERHARFPGRTNVEFVAERDGVRHLRVWERGVGETKACGTGACAATVALLLAGRARSPVELSLPGGVLTVEWDGSGDLWLSGACGVLWEGPAELEGVATP